MIATQMEESNMDPTAVFEKLIRVHQESQNQKETTETKRVNNANKFEEDIEKIMKTTEQQAGIYIEKEEESKEHTTEQDQAKETSGNDNGANALIIAQDPNLSTLNDILDLRKFKIDISEYKHMDDCPEELRDYIQPGFKNKEFAKKKKKICIIKPLNY